MTAAPFPDIAAWPPTRYTPPLSPDFPSAFDRWAKVFAVAWVCAFDYALEEWQIQTIRAILEIDPATGSLRWQQAVVSLARQNGKTELAAALGLWMLLARRSPLIVGIASSKEQADLVYRRTMQAIERNPELAEMFARLTDTRGIQTLDGGQYVLKAAKSAALQGLPLDLGLVDELHLLRRALWGDLVSGTGGRRDCIVVGITTAGDASSELLIDLYSLGEGSISDDGTNRVFFAAWEAPEARVPEDDETLGRWLAMSNPRVANGGRDLPGLITLVRTKPEPDAIRYHLNRFLESVRAPYIPAAKWHEAARPADVPFPSSSVVFALDSAPAMAFVSITATARDAAGVLHTELVASLRAPTFDQLLAIVDRLAEYGPRTFAVDGYTLGRVGKEMQRRGYPVLIGSQADTLQAAALLFRLVVTGMCQHSGDALLSMQIPRAIRKNVGDAFRISRPDATVEVDAVIATALGVLAAEVTPESASLGVF